MLNDPLGAYQEGRRRHAELHRQARHHALAAAEKPSPRWRIATAIAFRHLADRVDGLGSSTPQSARAMLNER